MNYKEWVQSHVKEDECIVITGSTSGIGYEYLKAFAEMNCRILCVSNEKEKLAEQKRDFEARTKAKIETFHVDLRSAADTKALGERLNAFPIKVLINNAGFGLKGRFESKPVDDFIDIISVNVTAPVILARALIEQMQKRNSGLIIHIASINAIVPIPNNQIYTATKAFVASYALAVARENKDSDLLFQLVMPGTTKTPFHDRQGANPSNLVMLPDEVVRVSLEDVERQICIPNKADRFVSKLIPFLPKNTAMDIAAFMLKKRLGV